MKVSKKEILQALIVVVGAYILYSKPLGTALAALGVGAVLFAFTRMEEAVLLVFAVALFAKSVNKVFVQSPLRSGQEEGFQAHDATTVQARLENVKGVAPLAPKVEQITGVLESANILDNSPLQAMDYGEGAPGASIPASAKARVLIYPVAEESIPAPSGSIETPPMANPVLQNGQDYTGIETAMAREGARLPREEIGASEMAGVASGAGMA
jgi:hypothetical protein